MYKLVANVLCLVKKLSVLSDLPLSNKWWMENVWENKFVIINPKYALNRDALSKVHSILITDPAHVIYIYIYK